MPRTASPSASSKSGSVTEAEISRFNALAAQWWDSEGAMAPLHRMNPVRLRFIVQALTARFGAVKGLEILDVGCGGGLVTEAMTRLQAKVTGIDAAADLIQVAKTHAAAQNLRIDYRTAVTADVIRGGKTFDCVLALEVIEHVPEPAQFIAELSALTKPNGMVILSTLNRTAASFAFGIMAAEYLLRWLPRGTHDWQKFLKPSELHDLCIAENLHPVQTMGLRFHPMKNEFHLDETNLSVNYFLVAVKK